MGDQVVKTGIEGSVATVTLNRPDKRNAINGEILEGLKKTFEELSLNSKVGCVVLRGEGACFSSGIDFMYLMGLSQIEPGEVDKHVRFLAHQVQTVMNTVENCEKPVVAQIHGFCGGLGLELALACDFRLGNASSLYGLPEMVLGLVPDCGGTTRITRTVGITRAKELVMLGDMIDAATADKYGFMTRIFPDDQWEDECNRFVQRILDRPVHGMGLAKRLIDLGAGVDKMTFMDIEATMQSILISRPDFAATFSEGMVKMQQLKKERQEKK